MTPSDDKLLRDALGAEAGSAEPSPDGFATVRHEANRRLHRRRAVLAAVAAIVVIAVGTGTVFAVSRDNDKDRISAGPSSSTDSTPTSSSTTTASTTTTAPTTSTTTTVPAPTTGTLPPATDVAGMTAYRNEDLAILGAAFLADAPSPQAKVDALVAALRDEPIEGRRGAEGIVNSIQGNRSTIEVRVIGVASDSVSGYDYRLYLLQEQAGGPWKVVSAEVRDLCSRAYDGSLCV